MAGASASVAANRRRQRSSMCGADSGKCWNARSWTTEHDAVPVGGRGQEVRRQQQVEVDEPFDPRHPDPVRHRLEDPRGEPGRLLGEVRARTSAKNRRGRRRPRACRYQATKSVVGVRDRKVPDELLGVVPDAGPPRIERRARIDHDSHPVKASGLSTARRGSGPRRPDGARLRRRRCAPRRCVRGSTSTRPCTSTIWQPSMTIESSTALRSDPHVALDRDTFGPTTESSITAPGPIDDGTSQLGADHLRADGETDTAPRAWSASSTSPSTDRGARPRASPGSPRADRRGARCPSTTRSTISARTVLPWSISHWIASVISYSPRHDGSSVSAASRIESSNRYTPTSARSLTNSFGFSTSRTTRSSSSTATPKCSGSGTRARKICASGRVALELVDETTQPLEQHVVAQVHEERLARDEVAGGQDGVSQTERRLLVDVGDVEPPVRSVADRLSDLVGRLRRPRRPPR